MTFDTKKKVSFLVQTCCICGSINCEEAIDHDRVEINQLKDIVLEHKMDLPQIDELKLTVRRKFYELKRELFMSIKSKEDSILKYLDSLYFMHMENKFLNKNVSIFCDVLENNLTMLPNRNLRKIGKINSGKYKTQNREAQNILSSVNEDIMIFLSNIKISEILSQVNKRIKTEDLVSRNKKSNQLSKSTQSVKTTHSNSSLNIKQVELAEKLQKYEWKHVRFTQNTKTVELNNRNITDQDIITQFPIISIFQSIKELQIRNNRITALSCNIIASQFSSLSMLDLRGNKVGDEGVCRIVNSMKRLKALYVSETGITDKTGHLISVKAPDLQTLWSEHTHMTGQVCIKISQKPKLRLLSLVGNPISLQHKNVIQIIFRSKGYLNV